MKYFLPALFVLISITAQAQAKKLTAYDSLFNTVFSEWKKPIKNFKLTAFKPEPPRDFDGQQPQDTSGIRGFYSIYMPMLTFSPDRKKFLDIYSYSLNLTKENGKLVAVTDVDNAVFLYNKKTGYWKCILFTGMSGAIEEVAWASDIEFVMVGSLYVDKMVPLIYVGNINTGKLIEYKLTDPSISMKDRYDSPKLTKMKIDGL